MKKLLTVAFLLISQWAIAQDPAPEPKNQTISLFAIPQYAVESGDFEVNNYSLNYTTQKETAWLYEVGIAVPRYSVNHRINYGPYQDYPYRLINYEFGIQAGIYKKLGNQKTLIPTVGIQLNSQLDRHKIRYEDSSQGLFGTTTAHWTNRLNLCPGLWYNFSKRFVVRLEVPVNLVKHSLLYEHVDNPSLPKRATYNVENTVKAVPWDILSVRLGLGLSF